MNKLLTKIFLASTFFVSSLSLAAQDNSSSVENDTTRNKINPYFENAELGVRKTLKDDNVLEAGFNFGSRNPVLNVSGGEHTKIGAYAVSAQSQIPGTDLSITGAASNIAAQHTNQYGGVGVQSEGILNANEGRNGLLDNVTARTNAGLSLGGLTGESPLNIERDPVTNKVNIEIGTPSAVVGGAVSSTVNLNDEGTQYLFAGSDLSFSQTFGPENMLIAQFNNSVSYQDTTKRAFSYGFSGFATTRYESTPQDPDASSLEYYTTVSFNAQKALSKKFALEGRTSVTVGSETTYSFYGGVDMEVAEGVRVKGGVNIEPNAFNPVTAQINVVNTGAFSNAPKPYLPKL